MKTFLFMCALFAGIIAAPAQPTNSFPLWPEGAPGSLGNRPQDVPTLTPFFPSRAGSNSPTIIICPGGGYGMLASHEGEQYARFLNNLGITAFVLKYRLGSDGYRHPCMLQDAARAVRIARANADQWGLNPNRIGIIGSSAGGHLASTLLTHFDNGNAEATDPIERASSRPDLGILCYPVISMGEFTHRGSRENLLGKTPSPELVRDLSNELKVTHQTPPCFVWSTYEDTVVPVENTLQFTDALRKAGVAFDLHIYQKGGHGMGLGAKADDTGHQHPWTRDLVFWLKAQGWTK